VQLRGRHHFIADSATLIGSVILEDECSVWFNTVIRGDNEVIAVGARSNIQDGSVLHADEGVRSRLAPSNGGSHGDAARLHHR
jgi:carbonic anhydrase/acetyltransferase-like protein (isoleucine patch superfamily)